MPSNCEIFCDGICALPLAVAKAECAIAPGSASCIAANTTAANCTIGCLGSCGLIGQADPPMPIAFDHQPCCQANGLNTGWQAVGRNFPNPILALEYQ